VQFSDGGRYLVRREAGLQGSVGEEIVSHE
jgi:hypothetical protein